MHIIMRFSFQMCICTNISFWLFITDCTDGLRLTGALLRRVLMPCLLFTTSSSLTGLNMNGAPADFGACGRHPCLLSYVRQVVHSKGVCLPPWCQSLDPVTEKWCHKLWNNFSMSVFSSDLTYAHFTETRVLLKQRFEQLLLTCCTTVAADLNVLFTVFTIKIILAGRTCIYCIIDAAHIKSNLMTATSFWVWIQVKKT